MGFEELQLSPWWSASDTSIQRNMLTVVKNTIYDLASQSICLLMPYKIPSAPQKEWFSHCWVSGSHELLHRMQTLGSGGNMQFLIKHLRYSMLTQVVSSYTQRSTAPEYAKDSRKQQRGDDSNHERENHWDSNKLQSKNLRSEEYLGLYAKRTLKISIWVKFMV